MASFLLASLKTTPKKGDNLIRAIKLRVKFNQGPFSTISVPVHVYQPLGGNQPNSNS